jgi:hypothetical protein
MARLRVGRQISSSPFTLPIMPTRRDFLATAASTSLLAAAPFDVTDLSLPLHAGERKLAEFELELADDTTDLSWVSRLRGKSRAVFDSPKVSEGGALFRAAMWRKQLNKVFGTPVEDVTPVVVFRHEAIPLVMNDSYWEHMGVGKDTQLKDAKGKWIKVNPIASLPPGAPPAMADYTLPAFIKSGGIVLACGLAFQSVVASYMDKDKIKSDEAQNRAKENLIPGVIIQPSGFFAVLKAQDEGCKYMMGS